MDFKSLISKIGELNDEIKTVAAPVLPKAPQLNEDAQLRVLAGTSSILEEAKKMKKEEKTEKVDEGGLDMNLVKAAQKGQEGKPIGKADPESDKNVRKKYGYRMDGEPAERDDDETKQDRRGRKRKNTGESVELDTEKFKEKFTKMVEAKKAKKDKKMEEGSKPDFLDVDKDGDKKEPMKKASKEAGKGEDKKETKGLSAKQKKLPPGLQKAIAKKKGTAESVKASKKVVAESVEKKLTFKEMVQLVQESGGQQQIDPVDKALFTWAERVAKAKLGEGMKADLYAGLVYERNGGRFEMYDVLAETRK